MPDINLSPYTAESAAIARKMRLAEALQQQALSPLEMPTMAGVPISPYAGLAKMLQAYSATRMRSKAEEREKTLADTARADTSADFGALLKGLTPTAAIPEGPSTFTPNVDQRDIAENPRMVMKPEINEFNEVIQPGEQGAGSYGVTPGTPAIAATTGKLTAEGFSAMQTPEGRQQYMAQLLAQIAPKAPIKLGMGETLLDPRNYSVVATGPTDVNKGLAPLNQKDYTPESWKAATAGGGMDRSKLMPFTEGPASLAVYNLYVKQMKEAGKVPKSIEQFQTDQQIAGRPQAQARERFVYDAARGGRVNLDTGELLPVTQGGQPIGGKERPLSTGEVDKITAIDVSSGTQKRLAETFQDAYGGYPLKAAGEMANVMGAKFGGPNEAQAQWWASHEANDNVTRNVLFGSSLTAGEQKAWERTTIHPGMKPSMIKERMIERQALIDAKRSTTVSNLEKAGYDVKGFKDVPTFFEKASESPPISVLKEGQTTTFKNGQSWTLQQGKPVQVK